MIPGEYLFKLDDSYSEAVYIAYNYLCFIIGFNIIEAV